MTDGTKTSLNERWIGFLVVLLRKRFVNFFVVLMDVFLGIAGFAGLIVGFGALLIITYLPNSFSTYAQNSTRIVSITAPIAYYYVLLKPLLEAKRRLREVRSSEGQN